MTGLTPDSQAKLDAVHPNLADVVRTAARLYHYHFPERLIRVTSGLRTRAEQDALFMAGKTPARSGSRHLSGEAVDLCILADGGKRAIWTFGDYKRFDDYMRQATAIHCMEPGHHIQWGGEWTSRDGVHWQYVD